MIALLAAGLLISGDNRAAIVAADRVALRAEPRDSAAVQAQLFRGDWLEVRGEEPGFLKVYDHRRERPGFVRRTAARAVSGDAGELRAIVAFLRGEAGAESLGIGYAALYLRAGGAAADVEAAIGELAERLALRTDALAAAHRDVAEAYGVKLASVDREGRVLVCYDGEAERRVLSLQDATPEDRAQAALALTADRCVDPAARPSEVKAWNEWRVEVLARVQEAPGELLALVRLRRAEALSALAYQQAREGDARRAAVQADTGLQELQLVDRAVLAEENRAAYASAALRVAAVRWAAERGGSPLAEEEAPLEAPGTPAAAEPSRAGARLVLRAGKQGETCVRVAGTATERCTWGLVWAASARRSPRGEALTVAVQPMPAWTELWVFRKLGKRWVVDALTPSSDAPGVGYAEAAGFSPDGARLLVAREAIVRGRLRRRFQILQLRSLRTVAEASTPGPAFSRYCSPAWRGRTLALR